MTEEQAREMVKDIREERKEGESWEPTMKFDPEEAEEIQRRLRTQLKVHEYQRE